MKVAPHDACVSCFRGDTTTAFALTGESEWIVAGIHRWAGLNIEEATGMVELFAERELGCECGKVPGGIWTQAVLLCGDCARRTGAKVGPLDSIPTFEWGGDDDR